jgi:hypothetical protein
VQDPLVLHGVDRGDFLVQLGQRGDIGNGEQVVAAKPAALLSTPPFSWAPSWLGMQ